MGMNEKLKIWRYKPSWMCSIIVLLILLIYLLQKILDSYITSAVSNKVAYNISISINCLYIIGTVISCIFLGAMLYRRQLYAIIFFIMVGAFPVFFVGSYIDNNRQLKMANARFYSIRLVGDYLNEYIMKTNSFQSGNQKWIEGLFQCLEEENRVYILTELSHNFSLNKISVPEAKQVTADTIILFEKPMPHSPLSEELENIKSSQKDSLLLWRFDSKIIQYCPRRGELKKL